MWALSLSFYERPAEVIAPDLIGCLLVKRQADGELLWGVIMETEAYPRRPCLSRLSQPHSER